MAQEYYVRQPDSEVARGPFTVDKLQALGEIGQIDSETLFFDEAKDCWRTIISSKELHESVFPEKKRLTLRKKPTKEERDLDDEPSPSEPRQAPIRVEEMLAAAQGETSETRYVRRGERMRDRAASILSPVLTVLLVISALCNILPAMEIIDAAIAEGDPFLLLRRPLAIVGALDLFFAVCVFLAATEIFPIVRFRAALGLGYFAFFYWASYHNNGNPNDLFAMYSTIATNVGIFACTVTLNLYVLVTFAAIGLVGALGFGYFTFLGPLLAGG